MPSIKQETQQLLGKFLDGNYTASDLELLRELLKVEVESEEVEDMLLKQLEKSKSHPSEVEVNWSSMLEGILQSDAPPSDVPVYTIGTDTKKRRMIWPMVAAAAIIAIVSTLVFITVNDQRATSSPVVVTTPTDIKAPENNRAVITLADGRKVYLDSAGTGTLATQQNTNVIKNENGEIVYKATDITAHVSPLTFNTLYNPRGSKVVTLALADGTKVWLNSESSLRYPTAFTGNGREVEITGEAYFEVSPNAAKPFHVKKGEVNVQVLGTHFNVNAYEDEAAIKVTLLEGLVEVKSKNEKVKIRPGEQATITSDFKLQTSNDIDLGEVMAWKEGQFIYTNADLPTIMQQMARWYDVEVVYQDKITDKYTVNVSRDVPVSKLFQFLEMSGGVRFEIEGKKVTVKK